MAPTPADAALPAGGPGRFDGRTHAGPRKDAARAAYRQAIATGHADQAPIAAFNLGVLEQQQGEPDAARAAYRQAMSLGNDELAQRASEAFEELDDRS